MDEHHTHKRRIAVACTILAVLASIGLPRRAPAPPTKASRSTSRSPAPPPPTTPPARSTG